MDLLISIIQLLGGVALLIYGMKLLSSNLKKLSGGKLETILTHVTDNKFKGLLAGILITVATQSSAATTVIVVGLVSANMLKLKKAIPIIMGANIGTTITSQILRLTSLQGTSWLSLLNPSVLAPILILIGVLLLESSDKRKNKTLGQLIVGIGLLFTGMISMVNIASSFSKLPILTTIFSKLSNPILGVFAGAFVTLVVQSSAATVGILQALSSTGITTFSTAIPIILGQNIGTCGTSIISSIGSSKNAKRAAAVHLYFNLIGTIIFLLVIYSYQYFVGFPFWNESINMGQIANFHTLFNVISTIVLFPFTSLIEKLTILTIKDNKDQDEEDDYLSILSSLDERVSKIPNLAILNSTNIIEKMNELSEKNLNNGITLINNFDSKILEKIKKREDAIDTLDKKIAEFLVELWKHDLSNKESITINSLLKIESEYEKIGDYTYSFSKTIEDMNEKNIVFSDSAFKDLEKFHKMTLDTLKSTKNMIKNQKIETVVEIEALKEFSEIQKEKYRNEHIKRLKDGTCNVESGIAFLELLTISQKIINHCLNVSISALNYMTNQNFISEQEFRKEIYKTKTETIKNKLNEYSHKYSI